MSQPPTPQRPSGEPPARSARTSTWILVSGLIIIVLFLVGQRLFRGDTYHNPDIPYNEFVRLLDLGQITEVNITQESNSALVTGKLAMEEPLLLTDGKTLKFNRFQTTIPAADESFSRLLVSKGVRVTISKPGYDWTFILITSAPWILLILIYLFFMRRMQASANPRGEKNVFNFGKSRAKLQLEGEPQVTFKDVAGCEEAKEELREIVDFLKTPEKFTRLGGKIPKGVLLLGPPGTGKTLLARAIAGEAGVPFFSLSGADFVEMFVGVGASRVRDVFEQGKKHAPSIIFIDELDAVGRQRGAGLGGGHDEREQTLNALLVELDGFDERTNVILIAATNRPDILDTALLRPGRFDRQVVVDRPDVKGREGILRVHSRKIPLGKDVDLELLARVTPGMSGADLANLVNEAVLIAARDNCDEVSMIHFERAKDKILTGVERKSVVMNEREKKITAYHEAGHALVARYVEFADPVHKVTIIPRGRALGVTTYLPTEDKYSYSRQELLARICFILGGRVSEKIIFGDYSTGASNDIEQATNLARKMICEFGMSDQLGPVSYGSQDREVFLGRDFGYQKNFSEKTAVEIDQEILRLIRNSEDRAEKLLRDHIAVLHEVAETLLVRETITGDDIDQIIKRHQSTT
ncbi:MAG: ATP-dependent metallopeptidase FtsH/Yme1/Tma family protein [Bacteroidetes bacterium]|nr:ATP-dependent metallopeptidase FtsH/Yme1/Tma family protein [Bacteroidota bacterium]